MRLQKYLASSGVASRREAENLILQGVVSVNGKTVTELGTKIDPEKDVVTVNGREIKPSNLVYFLLNKPKGYTTTVKDKHAKNTVIELIDTRERIFPVGRLDKDTEGLLLLTNDGDLTNKLTHPRYGKEKEYIAVVSSQVTVDGIKELESGVMLDGKKTAPARVTFVRKHKDNYEYSIIIREGRNRQIRKMFALVGYKVLELKRTRLDFLTLGNLKTGEYRELSSEEVKRLKTNSSPLVER